MTDPVLRKPPLRHFPLRPHHLQDRVTPTDLVFYIAPLGAPSVDPAAWALSIDGMVGRPRVLTLAELRAMPQKKVEAMHQCAGNPAAWDRPTRRITNVVWTGVLLSDLLAEVGVDPRATHLWSYGQDSGVYGSTVVDAYIKDIPIEVVASSGALIAYELNGEPLRPCHGFPLRLVVPGYYGTNSVKWLTRLRLEDRRADGFFTTALYNDPTPDGGTRPVWEIAPESVIVQPAPDAEIDLDLIDIRGWAWACDEIASVDVSTDGGAHWARAELQGRSGRTWQRFRYVWRPERHSRTPAMLLSRATDVRGETQPMTGARNAVYGVPTIVIPSAT
jgi:DMSO/TMAO reductase YedYZ molybdopterin-dependent catalytic subunit